MPRRAKKLRERNDDDDDLLEKRMEYAENATENDDSETFTYGICDWCDLEHYLIEIEEPINAELCRFCVEKFIQRLESKVTKLKLVASSSP